MFDHVYVYIEPRMHRKIVGDSPTHIFQDRTAMSNYMQEYLSMRSVAAAIPLPSWCCRKSCAPQYVHELIFSAPHRTRLHTQGYVSPWLHKVKIARAPASHKVMIGRAGCCDGALLNEALLQTLPFRVPRSKDRRAAFFLVILESGAMRLIMSDCLCVVVCVCVRV